MVGLCYGGYSGQRTFPAYDIPEMNWDSDVRG
jgi:hypothetical protein